MVETKSLEQTRKNWEASHGRVPTAYVEGVTRAKDVISKAIAAEGLYAEKVQASIATQKRARKLAEVTDEDWRKAAREKGAPRIAAGMAASKEKFAKGIARVLDTIQSVNLPARTADPMQNVDQRVKPIVAALSKLKE